MPGGRPYWTRPARRGPGAGSTAWPGSFPTATAPRAGPGGRLASRRLFIRPRQLRHEPVVEFEQALDDDLGLAQDRHEVGVAIPARDDVPVEVSGEPGAGRL